MARKRSKLSIGKNQVAALCEEEEITELKQKLINLEAQLKLNNTEKKFLRKRVKTLEKELVEKEDLYKRVTTLETELVEKEDQLILSNAVKEYLTRKVITLQEELMKNEAEQNINNTEKKCLRKQVKTLEQELAEKEDLRKRVKTLEKELAEKQDLHKRITTLETELAEKEDQLNLSNREKEYLTRKVITLQEGLMKNEAEPNLVKEQDVNDFPAECIVEIFKHLSHNELGQIARVCRRWNDLIKSPVLWRNVNVKFHWSHTSQNDILLSFINKLPFGVTSINVVFEEIENWILPLDFQKVCITLQEKCPHLQKLILKESKLSNTHPSVIHLCSQFLPNVTKLALIFPEFLDSPARVQSCIISKMEYLNIIGSDIRHFNKTLFLEMPNLKKLNLSHTDIDDTWFQGNCSFLDGLEILHLDNPRVGSTAFHAIKNHGLNLKKLYMCCTTLKDDDLKFTSTVFTQLRTICLNHCKFVTHEGVVSLVKSCPSLLNIYVNGRVAMCYAKHPFITANRCKLGVVKTIDCFEHSWQF